MSFRTATRTRLGSIRKYPTDLAVVSIAAVVAYLVVTSVPPGTEIRLFVTFGLALFFPGYGLVSVLFPAEARNAREAAATEAETRPRGIDVVERLGLSFALSIAVVPPIVLLLGVTEWGVTPEPAAAALGVVTVAFAQLGAVRRLRTPEADRFTFSLASRIARVRRVGSGLQVSSVLLVIAIGVAVGALLVGFLAPAATGGFAELALYSENEDGDLVAGDLPDEVAPGESVPITVAIENHEDEQTEYTAVVQQQTLENGEVVERTELGQLESSVSPGDTATREYEATPTAAPGETVRISVLLYEGEPPVEPTNDNAVEDTYFWVTVTEDAADGTGDT
ncbi:hypothetical protein CHINAEXTREME_16585 [Halobiforma lacisalsi AJ5]|uniref:DUF1616 domain-containing protein n=1 Tax=Natronobacterium lacisalsi AJ5 TaxID=358396 RepID=M0LCM0_NATLA|nr:DUF1616 domain-containing protein [Halobiforma lacisalsi]APW99288.1 hypothetical protein CHINAEXTREME_16585 [Halobiforma lacisalsi AJ5]EMA30863.1 hypothetical protein C445_16191 [Halobiforma lacisalsi AJ5]